VSLQRFAAYFKTKVITQAVVSISCCRATSEPGALLDVRCLGDDCGYDVLQQYDAVVLPVVLRLLLHQHNPPLHLLPRGRFQNNGIVSAVARPYSAVQVASRAPRRPPQVLDGRLAVASAARGRCNVGGCSPTLLLRWLGSECRGVAARSLPEQDPQSRSRTLSAAACQRRMHDRCSSTPAPCCT
jgi:hypothetical protein